MSKVEQDQERERRIDYEVVVDAYNEEERAMGWYYYLQDRLQFPFKAKWLDGKKPEGRNVTVIGMSSEDDCLDGMFVEVEYLDDVFSARLSDIELLQVDEETAEAIADWHYWVESGYEF